MDIDNNYTEDPRSTHSAKVNFLREALYIHVKQVGEFCNSGFRRMDSLHIDTRAEQFQAFSAQAVKLLDQLGNLLTCARKSPNLSNTINLEQIEAKAEFLLDQLDSYEINLDKSA